MSEIKKELFVSDKCSDCKKLMAEFEKDPDDLEKLDWEVINITESMANLKRFLAYRDSLKQFEQLRKDGRVGIPALVIRKGEEVIFHFEHKLKDVSNKF